jgi:DNA-binding response OmpR family regulator
MIVDDEIETVSMIKAVLISAGMDVVGADSGLDAIEKCPHAQPDVILLDLMMPGMDGYEAYSYLRNITNAPVLIVSAKTQKEDVVEGLQFGADDYVTKPFYPAELVARINNVVRRSRYVPPITTYTFPNVDLHVDLESREVVLRGKQVLLPNKEFEVLAVLARQAPKLVTKDVISREVWGENNIRVENRIKYFIHLLRNKMETDIRNPRLIVSREGLGYRLATDATENQPFPRKNRLINRRASL